MAEISKLRLRAVLEDAMGDVAMLMSDSVTYQQRLLEIRARCAEVWNMAELGDDLPEYEVKPRAVKVS